MKVLLGCKYCGSVAYTKSRLTFCERHKVMIILRMNFQKILLKHSRVSEMTAELESYMWI
jgi:hypothetical protein